MNDPGRRVLFITTAYPAHESDPRGQHVRRLAEHIAGLGMDLSVLAPTLPGAESSEVLGGVHIYRFRYSPLGREQLAKGVAGIVPNLRAKPHLVAQLPLFMAQMTRHASAMAGDFDLIHAHWVYPTGWVARRIRRRLGIPVVVTAHGGDVNAAANNAALGRLVKSVGNSVDRVLAVSDDLVTKLKRIGVDNGNVMLSPLGVDLPPLPPRPRDTSARVVFVGSLIHRKGVDVLLRALESVPEAAVQVEVVGAGPERAKLESYAAERGLPVHFVGSVAPADVAGRLQNADVFVLPSRSEGRPVAVMEAMAEGLAIVASDIPGNRELIDDSQNGLLFDLSDPSTCGTMLDQLARDPDRRHRLGLAARQSLVDRGLTATAAAERHVQLYEELWRGEE